MNTKDEQEKDIESEDLSDFTNAGALDTLKELGPMSEVEHDYYMNL